MGATMIPNGQLEQELASALDSGPGRLTEVSAVLERFDWLSHRVLACKGLSTVVYELAPNESACRGVATAVTPYCSRARGPFCRHCPLPWFRQGEAAGPPEDSGRLAVPSV